ncbi:MAG TPA: DUF6515 family protein [Usitatibacteraceae bacterium]
MLTILALGGVLAVTAAEARSHVSVNIGVSGYYGGGYWHGGYRHGYYGGYGYRPYYYGPYWNVAVAPIILSTLPFGYTTVWVEGNPYYYANNVYYEHVPNGYRALPAPPDDVVMVDKAPDESSAAPQTATQAAPQTAAPAAGAPVPSYAQSGAKAAAPSVPRLYAYPRNGQTATQATFDRIECERWASGQTGFNPAQSPDNAQRNADYHRAVGACLEGRGYSVK